MPSWLVTLRQQQQQDGTKLKMASTLLQSIQEYTGYKHKYNKICGSRETQNGRPCMGILIVQSFKVNDKGVFSLLELKFRNEMWPRIMTNPTMSMLPPLDILLAKSRAV